MTIIVVLLFFRSICLYLQNLVLYCYEKLNPKQKHTTLSGGTLFSSATGNQYYRNYRSTISAPSALDRLRANEREHLLKQIRSRKRAKLRS